MKKKPVFQLRILDRKIRWIFAFSLLALFLFMAVLYQQNIRQRDTRYWLQLTNQTIRKTDTLNTLYAETEAAVSVYIATGDTGRKKQAANLQQLITASINGLAVLTADNGLLQYNIRKLQQLNSEKQAILTATFSVNPNRLSISKNMAPDSKSQQLTGSLKLLLGSIREIEKGLLTNRILQNETSFKTSIYTALAGGVLAFLLVLAILFQLNSDILLRKKAEEEVALSESKYRSLTENAGVVMYTTDKNGHISFANNRVQELTGYTAQELAGKHFSILLDEEGKEQVIRFYVKQFEKKTSATQLEFLIRSKSGETKWVEQSAQLLFDDTFITGFQCMVKDITEKKLVEEELSRSEEKRKENEYRLNAILDNSTALIYIKDLEGRYVTANKKFTELLGIDPDKVIGYTDFDFSPRELANHYRQTDETVINSLKPLETEEIIDTPHGRKNLLLLKFPLLSPDKKLLGVSGIATDVTDKAEMEKQNIAALQKAESAQQIQEQFLANMSHEIRTPMNGIQGMTRLLLETDLSDEQKRFTNIISRSLNNLVVIVNNVLDFSNLKTGKLIIDSFAFDLPELLDEVKKFFEHPLSNKGLAFNLIINKDVPHIIKGDAFRLKQVLTNLVGNAIKFTQQGSVELAVNVKQQHQQRIDIEFRLTDTGIGIPKDKLDTIFESFAQAGKKISSDYGGAGLGLTISKGLIDLQGGNISVISQPGVGSVFTFDIPFGTTVKEEVVASQSDYTERLSGKRILVVEDNPVNQRLIDFVLKKVNVTVNIAANGKEAVEMCSKNPPYDLIIMDLQMPVMDGYETTLYLRKEMGLQTPIIAMTATALKEDQDRSVAVGMNDFMIKPFDFNDLYTRLIRLLFRVDRQFTESITTREESEKLFDLGLLTELDDNEYVAEVLGFFLESTPKDIEQLQILLADKNWEHLSKRAHKIKGAAAMLKAKRLAETLGNIELSAKKEVDPEKISIWVKDAVRFFEELAPELQRVLTGLKKQ